MIAFGFFLPETHSFGTLRTVGYIPKFDNIFRMNETTIVLIFARSKHIGTSRKLDLVKCQYSMISLKLYLC